MELTKGITLSVLLFLFGMLFVSLFMPALFTAQKHDHDGSPARLGGGVFRSTSYLDGGVMSACDGIPNGRNAVAHSNHGATVTDKNGTRAGCGEHRFGRNLPYHYITDRGTSATSRHNTGDEAPKMEVCDREPAWADGEDPAVICDTAKEDR